MDAKCRSQRFYPGIESHIGYRKEDRHSRQQPAPGRNTGKNLIALNGIEET